MLGLCLNRGEQFIELDPVEHLRPNAVDDSEGYLGSVLRRIDVHTKRPLPERQIHNPDGRFRDSLNVGGLGHDSGEGLLNFPAITFI